MALVRVGEVAGDDARAMLVTSHDEAIAEVGLHGALAWVLARRDRDPLVVIGVETDEVAHAECLALDLEQLRPQPPVMIEPP